MKHEEAIAAIERHLQEAEDEVTEDDLDCMDSEKYGRHFGYLSGLQSALDILKGTAA